MLINTALPLPGRLRISTTPATLARRPSGKALVCAQDNTPSLAKASQDSVPRPVQVALSQQRARADRQAPAAPPTGTSGALAAMSQKHTHRPASAMPPRSPRPKPPQNLKSGSSQGGGRGFCVLHATPCCPNRWHSHPRAALPTHAPARRAQRPIGRLLSKELVKIAGWAATTASFIACS